MRPLTIEQTEEAIQVNYQLENDFKILGFIQFTIMVFLNVRWGTFYSKGRY
jgi:hypothetical protein